MYNITIFPRGTLSTLDTTKEALRLHKAEQGKECIIGESRSCNNLEEVLNIAAQFPTLFSLLKDNKRSAANLISTQLAVIDIDEHFTIDQVTEILQDAELEFAIYTSYSHRVEGKDKFHVIIPLSQTVTDVETYKTTYNAIRQLFRLQTDAQTCSPANLFFNSNQDTVETFCNIGQPFQVVKPAAETRVLEVVESAQHKKLARSTMEFLINGAPHGEWHLKRNLATKDLKACGYTIDEAIHKLQKVTGTLDANDIYQIKYAYNNSGFEFTPIQHVSESHWLREQFKTLDGKPIKVPIKDIVNVYFKENHINVDLNEQFTVDGRYLDFSSVIEDIRNFAETFLKQQVNVANVESCISRMLVDNREARLKELQDYLEFQPSSAANINKLLSAITPDTSNLSKIVLLHFLWQIKRKLFNKKVTYHMMPVFVGRSGSGKSEFIKKLLGPLSSVTYMDGDFKKLVDTREAFNLIKYFIYFIDEMSKADVADVETIKNRITSETIQYRKLGTNTNAYGPNRITFIGAANVDIQNIVKDPTSARRFFQINTHDRMDWDTINEFDYLELWRAIDENRDEPYIMPYLKDIQIAQSKMKYKLPIEQFIEDKMVSLDPFADSVEIDRWKLWRNYCEWVYENGYKGVLAFPNFLEYVNNITREQHNGRDFKNIQKFYIRKHGEYDNHLTVIK